MLLTDLVKTIRMYSVEDGLDKEPTKIAEYRRRPGASTEMAYLKDRMYEQYFEG